ncbi:hypothetical protein C8F04DRAFT_1249202 [Mycena alexandri]|uniref:DUF6533 domain-containing protein n=1 Tax=Mycena alexandri TaxID=1745969 RepID=A0AAD6TKD3_9AGAR|nr:hypothetical protein C8F04DRAFT_1249202 [Mycena alexandri]
MSAEAAVLATRYVSAVGITALLYDHVLTSGDELWLIWLNPAAGVKYRAIFVFNRYVTEGVSLYAAYTFAFYDLLIHMCGVTQKPWALPVVLGVWVSFDFLVIILAVCNALEMPHHTDAEVMASLQQDGARMFVCLLALRLANFIVALVADPAYCFVTFTVLWAMCSIVTSRLQLRVERLRITRWRFGGLPMNFIAL